MKILIVSRSFYPENSPRAFRTTELVKEFARQGHKVTLLTSKIDELHVPFEKEYGVTIVDWGELKYSDIDTSASNPLFRMGKRVIRRALHLFLEYPNIQLMPKVKRALRNKRGFDLLISVAVPHTIHWGVAKARNANQKIAKTWVADCGDPYMGSKIDSFRKMFYFKYFEKAFCRKADYISVPIEGAKEAYYPEFREKIKVIPQGFKFDEVKLNKNETPDNEIITFAYAGGLFPGGRDPSVFLEYLVELRQPYRFILYTRDRGMVEPYQKKSSGKIEIRDYIPRSKLLKVLSGMDFLVNFENSTPTMMPSKLIDYYLTGRPVLSVKNKTVDKELLHQFLDKDYSGKLRYDNVDSYRIENVCKRFLELAKG